MLSIVDMPFILKHFSQTDFGFLHEYTICKTKKGHLIHFIQ
ncbi:hypothetical protein HMPREF1985_01678 [Mitsuokella sp. oral taxon 131 str. W9106]|nr:hypothetical protein HMPREF1985_01678 [Mitsuokella sp. oral taxon 131 str. W9106]